MSFLSIVAVSYHRLDSKYGCRRAEVGTVITEVVDTEEEGKQEGPVSRNPVIRYFSVLGVWKILPWI